MMYRDPLWGFSGVVAGCDKVGHGLEEGRLLGTIGGGFGSV